MWAVSLLEIRLKVALQKLSLQFWAFAMNLWGFLLFYEDERDSRHQNFIFKLETFDVRFCTTLYDLEHQRPSLLTFHQTNRLHDGVTQPLNLHFTNQRNILSKTSAEKNILNTQANQLLQAKQLFLIILQLHIFFWGFLAEMETGHFPMDESRVSWSSFFLI